MHRFNSRLVLLLGALGDQVACGGSRGAQTASAASSDVSRLSFFLDTSDLQGPTALAVAGPLRSAIVNAGFTIATDGSGPADALMVVRATAVPESSVFQVRVNGRVRRSEHVRVTVTVRGGGTIADESTAEFSSTDGQVNIDDVSSIAEALSKSPRVQALATRLLARRDAASSAAVDQTAANTSTKSDHVADEDDWTQARALGCAQPATLTACDGVRSYLARHPRGAHASDATSTLGGAQPLLERLQKDENSWQASGFETCRRDATRDACAGVEIYRAKYGAGLHVDEANSLLGKLQ